MTDFAERQNQSTPLTWTQMDGNWEEVNRRIRAGWVDIVSQIEVEGGSGPSWSTFRSGISAWALLYRSPIQAVIQISI